MLPRDAPDDFPDVTRSPSLMLDSDYSNEDVVYHRSIQGSPSPPSDTDELDFRLSQLDIKYDPTDGKDENAVSISSYDLEFSTVKEAEQHIPPGRTLSSGSRQYSSPHGGSYGGQSTWSTGFNKGDFGFNIQCLAPGGGRNGTDKGGGGPPGDDDPDPPSDTPESTGEDDPLCPWPKCGENPRKKLKSVYLRLHSCGVHADYGLAPTFAASTSRDYNVPVAAEDVLDTHGRCTDI